MSIEIYKYLTVGAVKLSWNRWPVVVAWQASPDGSGVEIVFDTVVSLAGTGDVTIEDVSVGTETPVDSVVVDRAVVRIFFIASPGPDMDHHVGGGGM